MLCDENQGQRSRAFLEKFSRKTFQQRVPLIGGIELTSRCNLDCVHCYIGIDERKKKGDSEVPARQWMDWIDQFAEAGSLYLLFTGGETLLRPDFPEIYAHACRRGMLGIIFTNGTLVSEKIIDVFETYPPHSVEITLYGATAATYEKITGVSGSFEKCMKGIQLLKGHGFHLKLKTMLLSLNCHELEDMQKTASDLKISFRYDAAVSARLDGDRAPLRYRVPAEMVIEKESVDHDKLTQWYDLYQRVSHITPSDNLYACGAGRSMFHVDSSGILRPCFMVPGVKYDLKQSRFYDMWYEKNFMNFQKPGEVPLSCKGCDNKSLCGYCPGFFKIETGDERSPSDFLCAIGGQRKKMILNFISEEKNQ